MQYPHVGHPSGPRSNVAKVGDYDPNKYALVRVMPTVTTQEALLPNCPPALTMYSLGMYLKPLTKELEEQPTRPTVSELPEEVIDRMVQKERAFWVDKPGANAHELHDAYNRYGMTTEKVLPTSQAVFPRSYQYELECVKYRTERACAGLRKKDGSQKKMAPYCRDCQRLNIPALSPFQETSMKRWRYYPDLTANLTKQEIKELMKDVGRPFQNEACNWYNKNYPSTKFKFFVRKFSK